jgi:dipeptidyl aminopeptidase/acylaminoacyl peptidase
VSFDGLEIPAFLFRPRDADRQRPAAAIVCPHGGPTNAYIDAHDPRAQYFVAKGDGWLAPNFRGSTGYGRDFERRNHGVWASRTPRTASPPRTTCAASTGWTATGSRSSAAATAGTWR